MIDLKVMVYQLLCIWLKCVIICKHVYIIVYLKVRNHQKVITACAKIWKNPCFLKKTNADSFLAEN
jgi:Ni,Fe-hydrogenase I cytochrome b subunit